MKSLHLLIVCALVLAAAGARAELNPFTEAANLGLGKGMEIYNNTVSKPPTNAVVPGFSAGTQPQQSIFSGGKGDLASPGVTRSAACAGQTDIECAAVNLLNWGPDNRILPAISPTDPLITNARNKYKNPADVLGSFADPNNNVAGDMTRNIRECKIVNTPTTPDYQDQICNINMLIDDHTCNSVLNIDLDPWTTYRCLKVNYLIEAKTCDLSRLVEVHADYDYQCERTTQVKKTLTCKKTLNVTCTQPQPDGCNTGGVIPGSTQGDMVTSFEHIGGGTYELKFGTFADNYWAGWGEIFDRSLEFQIANLNDITQFELKRAAFDDWLYVSINNQRVYVGPYGGHMLDVKHDCGVLSYADCLTPSSASAYQSLYDDWNAIDIAVTPGSYSNDFCGGYIIRTATGWGFSSGQTPYFEWTAGTEPKIIAAQSPELKACQEIEKGFKYIHNNPLSPMTKVVTNGLSVYSPEQNTSWDRYLNIDLRPYLVNGLNRIRTRTIVAGNGESAISIHARMACPFVCSDEWINGCAALEARQ